MMQSDTLSWSAAILLSLFVHSMIFMQSGAQIGAEDAAALQMPLITRLNFNQPVARPVPDEPRPVEKQSPKPVKKVAPRPVAVKPRVQPPDPVEKDEPVNQPVSQRPVQGQQIVQPSEGLLKRKRQQYLHTLMSHIESHKFYPRAARRRAVEGNVKIAFILRDDGYYEQLVLNGSRKVLIDATRQALETARPLPAPPKDIGLPRQIELTMVYSLTN